MRSRKRRSDGKASRRYLLIATLTLVALGACAPETADWTPVQSPKKNRIDWVSFHHTVEFGAPQGELSPAARQALARFIDRLGRGDGVRVLVSSPGTVDGAIAAGRREAAVSTYLRELGVRPELTMARRGTAEARRAVTVTVGRYVVTTPRCPDWSKPTSPDYDNRVSSNYGCATESNLGLMVANPGDLLYGRPIGPADGETEATSIEAYRKGEAKEAPAASTMSINVSGGGS